MFLHRRPGHVEPGGDIGDRHLLRGEHLENVTARRIGEGAEGGLAVWGHDVLCDTERYHL